MNQDGLRSAFYIDDHAVLYALLVKNAIEAFGVKGETAARNATAVYGRERGLRMAMRCTADGNPLTPYNYVVYGEWADDRGWSEFRVGSLAPYELNAVNCGWNNAWKKHHLLEHGKMYCQIIDVELVRGFNPNNTLDVRGTISHGAEKCRFLYGGIDVASEADDKRLAELRRQKIPYVVKDFLYHTGHVLSAFRRTYLIEFGLMDAGTILKKSSTEYAEIFGTEKLHALETESTLDFLTI